MEQSFIKDRIQNQGIEVIIPEEADREIIHNVIYTELAKGIISDESRKAYLTIIDKLVANGAEGVILGCTEIGMLIKPADTAIPTFDTTVIHAEKAVELALQK
jgi:aspartate racemase